MSEKSASAAPIATAAVDTMTCHKCGAELDVSEMNRFEAFECPACDARLVVPAGLGDFTLFGAIGSGGMGGVYLARDEKLGRLVAIKVIRSRKGLTPKVLDDFRKEARAAAQLNHPHVAQVYSFGEKAGQPYLVIELVPGLRLDELIKQEGKVDLALAVRAIRETAEGLQAAEHAGLIHSDVKPENILLDAEGHAKLVDFGIAAFVHEEIQGGTIYGSPYYIAPERIRRQPPSVRADIFSLGASLYYALAGTRPFEAPTRKELLDPKLRETCTPLTSLRPEVPPRLAEFVHRMIQADPAQRPDHYAEVVQTLREIGEGLPPPQLPRLVSTKNKLARLLRRIDARPPGSGGGSRKRRLVVHHGARTSSMTGTVSGLGVETGAVTGTSAVAPAPAPKGSPVGRIVAALAVLAGVGGLGVWGLSRLRGPGPERPDPAAALAEVRRETREAAEEARELAEEIRTMVEGLEADRPLPEALGPITFPEVEQALVRARERVDAANAEARTAAEQVSGEHGDLMARMAALTVRDARAPDVATDGRGTVLTRHWRGIGVDVGPRVRSGDFTPQRPPDELFLSTGVNFEGTRGTRFYQRHLGFVHPPRSGEYRFLIVSDDDSSLFLSSGEIPEQKRLIASSATVRPGEIPERRPHLSDAVSLEQGRRYYLEVHHLQRDGVEYLTVMWQPPEAADFRPVPPEVLSPWPVLNLDQLEVRQEGAPATVPETRVATPSARPPADPQLARTFGARLAAHRAAWQQVRSGVAEVGRDATALAGDAVRAADAADVALVAAVVHGQRDRVFSMRDEMREVRTRLEGVETALAEAVAGAEQVREEAAGAAAAAVAEIEAETGRRIEALAREVEELEQADEDLSAIRAYLDVADEIPDLARAWNAEAGLVRLAQARRRLPERFRQEGMLLVPQARLERLDYLKRQMLRHMADTSFPGLWRQDGEPQDVERVAEEGVRVAGRVVPWAEVDPRQGLGLVNALLSRTPAATDGRAWLGAAVYAQETISPAEAGRYIRRALELDDTLRPLVRAVYAGDLEGS